MPAVNKRLTSQYEKSRSHGAVAEEVHRRLCYLCEYFFGGDIPTFAKTLGVPTDRMRCVVIGEMGVTLNLMARIVQLTDVRAEWLLCGTGPILKATMADPPPQGLTLSNKLRSVYPLFSGHSLSKISRGRPAVWYPTAATNTAASDTAAQCLFSACGLKLPLLLFAGLAGSLYCRKLIVQLLIQRYLTGLIFTGEAIEAETPNRPTMDLNTLTKLGAMAGISLGEAVQRWGNVTRKSPIRLAQRNGIPFMAQVSVGEMAANFAASDGGAELGAALGACAYVDLLAIAKQTEQLAASGGVVLILGDQQRAIDFFLSVYSRVAATTEVNLTVIVFGARLQDESCKSLCALGGNVHFLEGDLAQVAEEFRLSCVTVFDGAFHDDNEDDEKDIAND